LSLTLPNSTEINFAAIAETLPAMAFQTRIGVNGKLRFDYISGGVRLLFGLSPDDVYRQPDALFSLVESDDLVSLREAMALASRNGTTWNWDGRIRIPSTHEIKWINWRARRLTSSSEHKDVWCGLATNITQSKLTQLELQRTHARLRDLYDHIQRNSEQERASIAREIHDDVGATLTAIHFSLADLKSRVVRSDSSSAVAFKEPIDSLAELVDAAVEGMRRACANLRPPLLDFGLEPALETYAKQFHGHTGVMCEFSCTSPESTTPEHLAAPIFRLTQEALNNVAKHAYASAVNVHMHHEAKQITLTISDNGRGFESARVDRSGHYGLRGMQERVAALRGNIDIDSAPGKGTVVAIRLPVSRPKAGVTDEPQQSALVDIGPRVSALPSAPVLPATASGRASERREKQAS
jgi:two-component system, NarL family, sensor histidine kinase UhpB